MQTVHNKKTGRLAAGKEYASGRAEVALFS